MSNTLVVTNHSEFYAVQPSRSGPKIYYPASGATSRDVARQADVTGDPPQVGGFAVYDTTISTVYAVGLYPTKEEAQKHQPSEAAEKPEAVFDEPPAPENKSVHAPKAKRGGLPFKKRT